MSRAPELNSLGYVIGLLNQDYSLNPGWFDTPFRTGGGPTLANLFQEQARRDTLLELLEQAVGSDGPAGSTPSEHWFPALSSEAVQENPTLHFVAESTATGLQLGVGFRHSPPLHPDSSHPPTTLTLLARVPLLFVSSEGDVRFPFHHGSQDGSPGYIRLEVQSANGLQAGPIHCSGLRSTLQLKLDAEPQVDVELLNLKVEASSDSPLSALSGLKLPDGTSHVNLSELDSLEELLPLLLAVIMAGIDGSKNSEAAAALAHIIGILGMDPQLPTRMDWLKQANYTPGQPGAESPLLLWFRELDALNGLNLWLDHWRSLIGPSLKTPETDPKPPAAGGTRENPWRIDLALEGGEPASPMLAFTLARESDEAGIVRLYPGVRLDVPTFDRSKSTQLELSLHIELLEVALTGLSNPAALPRMHLLAGLRGKTAETPLVGRDLSRSPDKTLSKFAHFQLGKIQAGLSLEGKDGIWTPKPLLELHTLAYKIKLETEYATGTLEKVDLTQLDRNTLTTGALQGLLSLPTLLTAALAALAGNTDASPRFIALLDAIGISKRASTGLVTLDPDKLKTYFGKNGSPALWLRDRFSVKPIDRTGKIPAVVTVQALVDLFKHSSVTAEAPEGTSNPTLLRYKLTTQVDKIPGKPDQGKKSKLWLELLVGRRGSEVVLELMMPGLVLKPVVLNPLDATSPQPLVRITLPDEDPAKFGVSFGLEIGLHPDVLHLSGYAYTPVIGAGYSLKDGFCFHAWPTGRIQGQGLKLKLYPSFSHNLDEVENVAVPLASLLMTALLEIDALQEWLAKLLGDKVSAKSILEALGLLKKVEEQTEANTNAPDDQAAAPERSGARRAARSSDKKSFLEETLLPLLPLLESLGQDKPFVSTGKCQLFYTTIAPPNTTDCVLHGLRLELDVCPLIKSTERDGKKEGLELSLSAGRGKDGTAETSSNRARWIRRASSDPADSIPRSSGFTLYLFQKNGDTVQLRPWAEIVSLELCLDGPGDLPLIDEKVIRLDKLKTRLFCMLDCGVDAADLKFKFGASLQLYDVGVSIGEGFKEDNEVAHYLLTGEASPKPGETAPAKDPNEEAVVPEFSIAFSYVNQLRIDLGEVEDGAELETKTGESVLWVPIHKRLGPLYVLQLGVRQWADSKKGEMLGLMLDGGLQLGPLDVEVDDLSLEIPLKRLGTLKDWDCQLKGLVVDINAEGVRITGGLRKEVVDKQVSYNGLCIVQAAGRTVSALGSYTKLKTGEASFYAFVVLPIPLGGPPMFTVEGLALGFGYNRNLVVPDIQGISRNEFLLLKALGETPCDQSKAKGMNQTALDIKNHPTAMLSDFSQQFPPLRGAFFLAVGLDFTSFKLVRTRAVLYLLVNRGVELGLVGKSTLQLPEKDPASKDAYRPLINVELALQVRFSTREGLLSVAARLTENSYLLDPSCKVQGGFAFYLWFGGQHSGDFVISLGGYHPRFVKPEHYPTVDRLGFAWKLAKSVTIKGEAYFALTPACIMAGGKLEAIFDAGCIRAWFVAWADILLAWDPFYYDIEIGILIGVLAQFKILGFKVKIKVEIGARVRLWGPPFAGEVEVDLCVISFTIPLGEGSRPSSEPLPWTGVERLLPLHNPYPSTTPNDTPVPSYRFRPIAEQGLLKEEGTEPNKIWKMRNEFSLRVETVVPFTSLTLQTQVPEQFALRSNPVFDSLDVLYADAEQPLSPTWCQSTGISLTENAQGTSIHFQKWQQRVREPVKGVLVDQDYRIDVRPMARPDKPSDPQGRGIDSHLTLTFRRTDGGPAPTKDQLRTLLVTVIEQNMPAALWDASYSTKNPEARTIPLLAGVRLEARIREADLQTTGPITLSAHTDPGRHAPLPFAQDAAVRNTQTNKTTAKTGPASDQEPLDSWNRSHPQSAVRKSRYRRAPPQLEPSMLGVVLE